MKILKYIIFLLTTFVCVSCDFRAHIDMNTMVIIEERKYYKNANMSVFRITYKDLKNDAGLDIYVVADKNAFEVGDTVKVVKVED